jgi:two-component system NarL family sensor kinase
MTLSATPQYPFLIGALLFGLVVVFFIAFILMYSKAQRKMLDEKAALRKAILQAEIEMREQTLKQVSQELHDNLGQLTSLISLNLKVLRMNAEGDFSNRISETQTLVTQLIHDVKNLSYSLSGKRINQYGLGALLQREVDRVRRTGLVHIQADLNEELISKIPTIKALGIFRIIQELFNNTLKHSQATLCTLIFEEVNDQIHIQFTDNGVGFNLHSRKLDTRGLNNMAERCHQMGGQFQIDSSLGNGVIVNVYLNFENIAKWEAALHDGKSNQHLPRR